MSVGGVFIRFGGLIIRILQFCCSAIGLGIFSYFLAVLADHNLDIARRWQAVEGLTGAATLYTIFGVLFTLCLGGNTFFGYLAVLLDILFIGAFIAVAWFTRYGADSCNGFVRTPLGAGDSNNKAAGYVANGTNDFYYPDLKIACRLNTAVFAVSIVACFLFLLSAVWQVMMVRHHKKEKAYGPGPNNNYTSGSGRTPFWKRRSARRNRDLETTGAVGAGGFGTTRASHETGTTLGGNNNLAAEPKPEQYGPNHNNF